MDEQEQWEQDFDSKLLALSAKIAAAEAQIEARGLLFLASLSSFDSRLAFADTQLSLMRRLLEDRQSVSLDA